MCTPWFYLCLWRMSLSLGLSIFRQLVGWRQRLTGIFTCHRGHLQSEAICWPSHWSSPLNLLCCLKWKLPEGAHDSGFTSIRQAFIPLVGVHAEEWMTRNLSLKLGMLADSAAKSTAAQQPSLDLLAKVVLNSCIALGHRFAEQGVFVQ